MDEIRSEQEQMTEENFIDAQADSQEINIASGNAANERRIHTMRNVLKSYVLGRS